MEILRLLVILLLIIFIILLGSEAIYKDRFAIIEGDLDCVANTSENALNGVCTFTNADLNFPDGFNKDNCIVISFGVKNFDDGRGYSYGFSGVTSMLDQSWSTEPRKIQLGLANNFSTIKIALGNFSTSEKTKYYRIVLMKIN